MDTLRAGVGEYGQRLVIHLGSIIGRRQAP